MCPNQDLLQPSKYELNECRQSKIYNVGLGVLKKEVKGKKAAGGRGQVNLGGASCMLVQLLWEFPNVSKFKK